MFQTEQFRKGLLLTIFSSALLFTLSVIMGKNACFLFFNADLGAVADFFFHWFTYAGDGAAWVLVGFWVLVYKRRLWPMLASAILISTLLVQVTKNYIFVAMPRPVTAITDHSLIHLVPGVDVHTLYSFPSGHTATAFTIFLMGCLLVKRSWIVPVGFCYALLVGYSRVYTAQHFPLDVAAGMLIAAITMFLSVGVQRLVPVKK